MSRTKKALFPVLLLVGVLCVSLHFKAVDQDPATVVERHYHPPEAAISKHLQETQRLRHPAQKSTTSSTEMSPVRVTQRPVVRRTPPVLSDAKHKLGQSDSAVYNLYNHVDVIQKYCSPGFCLPVKGDEEMYHKKCLQKALSLIDLKSKYSGRNLTLSKCTCSLKTQRTEYDRVALVSLPGSGNTWVRGLLERATGVCSGSLWCDPDLRASHFCGEGLRDTKTVVVKNHDSIIRWRGEKLQKGWSTYNKPEFDAAVFVYRNIYDALVAEHNRAIGVALWEASIREGHRNQLRVSNHVVSFGEEFFGDNLEWQHQIQRLVSNWETMVDHLLVKSRGRPVLIVHYEDLKTNQLHEVKRMVDFLGYDVPESILKERLEQKFTAFHRNHTKTFEHFTAAQREFIEAVSNRVTLKFQN